MACALHVNIFGVRVLCCVSVPPSVFRSVSVGVVPGALFGVLFSAVLPSGSLVALAFRLVVLLPFVGCLMASFVSFCPASAGSVKLGRSSASSLFPVDGVGVTGCVVVKAMWFSGSARSPLAVSSAAGAAGIWLVVVSPAGVRSELFCLSVALSPSDLGLLVASCTSAVKSKALVFPVVAAGSSDVAASSYFCGLAAAGPGLDVPADGVSLL